MLEITNFHIENMRTLLKIKDHFLFFKSLILCLIIITVIVCLFYLKIPMEVDLEGIVKCNKKECTYTVIAEANFQKYTNDLKEITFNKTEKVNKIVFEEPYVLNNILVSNMVFYLTTDELQNNQVLKAKIIIKEDTIISLFLKSLKGGDENA